MPEKPEVEERIRQSFQNVKNDINNLKISLEQQNTELKELKSKLKELIDSLSEIKSKIDLFKKSSNGNEGVNNNHQQSSTMNNNEQHTTTQTKEYILAHNELSQILKSSFQSLTDREFSVFVAIVELTKSLPEVTYTDLANKLNISEPTIRNVVNRLISKKIPLQKNRFFNKKVSLSLSKDIQDPNLLPKLINLHQNPHNQKTLFDI